jgi:hypothetical protein
MFPSACSFIVLVFIISLHVSAYMAIFKSVGYFIFICLKDSASLFFLLFFTWSHSACFNLCLFSVFFRCFCCFLACVCLLALSFCNAQWTIQCSRMLKYSIMFRVSCARARPRSGCHTPAHESHCQWQRNVVCYWNFFLNRCPPPGRI